MVKIGGEKKYEKKDRASGEGVEKREPSYKYWWEYKLAQPLWRTLQRFLKKLKIELPYDPAIPFLGIYPEKMKTLVQKDTCTPTFTAALLTRHESNLNVHQQMNG